MAEDATKPVGTGQEYDSLLLRATQLMAATELELQAKGYPVALVEISISRAQGAAQQKAAVISQSIRNQAYYDLLKAELAKAENWLVRQKAFLDSQLADNSEEEGGDS